MNELIYFSGGVVADISGVSKPVKLAPIIKRCRQYISAMNYAGKPVAHIDMFATHFDQAMRALNASAKEHSLPPVVGLRWMSTHDPFVANASAKDLVRMIDTDPDATPREQRMAEYLQRAIDGEDISRLVLRRG